MLRHKALYISVTLTLILSSPISLCAGAVGEDALRSIAISETKAISEFESELSPGAKIKMNITPRVWRQLKDAVAQLDRTIKTINPEAEIVAICLTPCALTRKVMIRGSDIDDMYIYIKGLNGQTVASLEDSFISWLRMDGLNLDSANAKPQLLSIDSLNNIEGKFKAEGKRRVSIYRNGDYRAADALLRESGMGRVEFLKYVARIRLLLLIGELSAEDVKTLISDEDQKKTSIKILRDTIEHMSELRLTKVAKELVFALDRSLLLPNRIFLFNKEERERIKDALLELCEKELVYIYKGKLVLGWRAHSPRWSDSFWSCQVEIAGEGTNVGAGSELVRDVNDNLKQRASLIEKSRLFDALLGGDEDLAERACIQITEDFQAHQLPQPRRQILIENMGKHSIFASAALMDFIKANMGYFKDDLLKILRGKLKAKGVKKIGNGEALVSHYIIRLLPSLVSLDETKIDEIARLLCESVLSSGEMPEFLVYSTIDCLVKINEYIHDKDTRNLIEENIRYYRHSEFSWIEEAAHMALIIMDISSQIEIGNLEKAVSSLGNSPIIVAYNKGVMNAVSIDDKVIIKKTAGAIGTPLYSLLKTNRGGIAMSSAITDVEKCLARAGKLVRLDKNIWAKYILHPEWEFERFYNYFSNPIIWLMHHEMLDRLIGDKSYSAADVKENVFNEEALRAYEDYKNVNQRFAYEISMIADVIPDARIFLQDYHLYLITTAIRQRKPDLHINHFIHTPWPSAEYLRTHAPEKIIKDMLESLLCDNKVGFHISRYAHNFMKSCSEFLGADCDYSRNTIRYKGREVFIQANPLSWSYARLQSNIYKPEEMELAQILRTKFKGKTIIARGERTDLTKGLAEGFVAFRKFLKRYPHLRDKACFAAWFVPSRLHIARFGKMMDEVKAIAAEINKEFSPGAGWDGIIETIEDWQEALLKEWPIIIINLVPEKPWFGLCAASDVALSNSFSDGMNLVVKDFATLNHPALLASVNRRLLERYGENAVRLNPSVIIASENMGAHEELKDAVISVDPYNIDEIADALYKAVTMSISERHKIATRAANNVSRNTLSCWIFRLLRIEKPEHCGLDTLNAKISLPEIIDAGHNVEKLIEEAA